MAIKHSINEIPKAERKSETDKKADNMVQVNFKMDEKERDILYEHFKDDGHLPSQGMRKLVREYMKRKNLL